jgi:hypothetical protein
MAKLINAKNPNPLNVVNKLTSSSPVSKAELGSLTSLLDSTMPLAEALLDPLLPPEVTKEVEGVVSEVLQLVGPLEALASLVLL